MTLFEARQILRAKPRFGDDSQIRADRFLVDAQERVEHIIICRRCAAQLPCDLVDGNAIQEAAWELIAERGGLQKWPEVLEEIPRHEWPPIPPNFTAPYRVLRSNRFLVQVFREGDGVFRLSVIRSMLAPGCVKWADGISWEELQALKTQAGYGESFAIEIYPADEDVVNVAAMRHLWILPEPLAVGWKKRKEATA